MRGFWLFLSLLVQSYGLNNFEMRLRRRTTPIRRYMAKKEDTDKVSTKNESPKFDYRDNDAEERANRDNLNIMMAPWRLGNAISAVGWTFVVVASLAELFGYGFYLNADNQLQLGTLEERDFYLQVVKQKAPTAAHGNNPRLSRLPGVEPSSQ